jgi:class 3 adenylate cyclase
VKAKTRERRLAAVWFADIVGFTGLSSRDEDAALRLKETFQAITAKLRIGIHLGEVVSEPDGDVYGDGVNTASRIQNEAEPGQVVVSEDVWRQIRQRSGYRFHALGERSLKGLDEPVRIYVVGGTPEAVDPAPSSTRCPRKTARARRIAVAPRAH